MLRCSPRGGVGRPGAHVLTDPGQQSHERADQARAYEIPGVGQEFAGVRQDAVAGAAHGIVVAVLHDLQDLGEAEGADERRQQAETAGQVGIAV